MEKIAKERRDDERARFHLEQRRIKDYSRLLFVDEISKDDRLARLQGYGYKGAAPLLTIVPLTTLT